MIELPLCAVLMIRIGAFPGGIRKISTSKGCRSLRSVDSGLRPNASEISLPAPLNFPFGEDHVSSAIFVVLTLCTSEVVQRERDKPRQGCRAKQAELNSPWSRWL